MTTKKLKSFCSKTIYLLPAIILIAVLFLWPIIMTVYYSLTNLALTGSAAANLQFIGLDNYKKLLTDAEVGISIKNTIIFVIGSVIGQTFLGFTIAYLMQKKHKIFRSVIGSIVLVGWVMPEMVAAICAYSFLTDKGTLNAILITIGIQKISWLFKYPVACIVAANIWHGTAYSMMIYQAALDNVSDEVKESAKMDGASALQNVFHIVIPIIKNTIFTNTMMITLMTLGTFGMIYTMTGTTVQTLPIFMYIRAFKNYQLGYGTAISMILLAIGVMFSLVYVKIQGKEVKE
ncbi:MAG: carbohydrate ABC transporter permease [Velocimicrobium sp.]